MTAEAFVAIAAGLLLPIQGATLFYVVSIERRLTRLETLQEVQRSAPPAREAPPPEAPRRPRAILAAGDPER